MNDNDVVRVIIEVLSAGYASLGLSDVAIKKSYQPTLHGIPSGRAVFLWKVLAPRYGFPWFRDKFNAPNNNFDTTDGIWRTPTYQLSGLATQDASDVNSLTASDIVEKGADILQSRAAQETFKASSIGIQRIQNVRVAYISDDRDRHEQMANFDFILSYINETPSNTPPISTADGTLQGV